MKRLWRERGDGGREGREAKYSFKKLEECHLPTKFRNHHRRRNKKTIRARVEENLTNLWWSRNLIHVLFLFSGSVFHQLCYLVEDMSYLLTILSPHFALSQPSFISGSLPRYLNWIMCLLWHVLCCVLEPFFSRDDHSICSVVCSLLLLLFCKTFFSQFPRGPFLSHSKPIHRLPIDLKTNL